MFYTLEHSTWQEKESIEKRIKDYCKELQKQEDEAFHACLTGGIEKLKEHERAIGRIDGVTELFYLMGIDPDECFEPEEIPMF